MAHIKAEKKKKHALWWLGYMWIRSMRNKHIWNTGRFKNESEVMLSKDPQRNCSRCSVKFGTESGPPSSVLSEKGRERERNEGGRRKLRRVMGLLLVCIFVKLNTTDERWWVLEQWIRRPEFLKVKLQGRGLRQLLGCMLRDLYSMETQG